MKVIILSVISFFFYLLLYQTYLFNEIGSRDFYYLDSLRAEECNFLILDVFTYNLQVIKK